MRDTYLFLMGVVIAILSMTAFIDATDAQEPVIAVSVQYDSDLKMWRTTGPSGYTIGAECARPVTNATDTTE